MELFFSLEKPCFCKYCSLFDGFGLFFLKFVCWEFTIMNLFAENMQKLPDFNISETIF